MRRFTKAIKDCLDKQNWYGALFISLTIPDVCGYLSHPRMDSKKRYKKWFKDYLKKYYRYKDVNGKTGFWMSANDCYALRCAILHSGKDIPDKQKNISLFYLNTTHGHCVKVGDKISISVAKFCAQMIAAVDEWTKDVESDIEVEKRIGGLVSINDPGSSPPIEVKMRKKPDSL